MNVVKARKDHVCSLCFGVIPEGIDYINERVTPWDHANNEFFFTYKAHVGCDYLWHSEIGRDYEYELPPDKDAWRQMTKGVWLKGVRYEKG